MRISLPRGAASLARGLDLFVAIVESRGAEPLSGVADRVGVPRSTAQRMAGAFVRTGLLARTGRGRYGGGLRLPALAGAADPRAALVEAARAPVQALAREIGATTHLGVLEGDMVTYLVKAHGGGPDVLTRELIQLEAYCSGIGKVLLAHLEPAAREAYLAAGPFVALTPATLTDPAVLRTELDAARGEGFARDRAELQPGLHCTAVPVRAPWGAVIAAISASSRSPQDHGPERVARLAACAAKIEARLGALPD